MALFDIFRDPSEKFIRKSSKILEKINSLEESVSGLPPEEFPQKTLEFKERLGRGESLDDILPEAFALVREAARRNLDERHYDVQLLGGMALHQGHIVEMKTGEGKTLVATLPLYLNALSGKGTHLVTVNDYLARLGAVLMGQVYDYLGLSVGVINSQNISYLYDPKHKEEDATRDAVGEFRVVYDFLRPCSRREAYEADITYGTNHEFGFDYLRDNLAVSADHLVQRGHHFAIVDEVDSILIDEARTPLIISSPAEESEDFYIKFRDIARELKKGVDYQVDEKLRAVTLSDTGIEKAERFLGVDNIYTEKGIKYVHHLETAVRASALFERDRDYVVNPSADGGEVVIVDPFTGRLQPGRRWSDGIHQAIEAKEGVKIKQETRSSGSITLQNYFRMYDKLSGMTGTAATSAEEFLKVYGLDVIVIPTNRPIARVDHEDLVFQTEKGKFQAIAKKVKELHQKGQPVLIGTISIEKNELLSVYLKQEGVPYVMLNAKNHEREGEVIAQAGRRGAVTLATNMAGRGIDIKLGGPLRRSSSEASSPEDLEEYELVKGLGGLFVLGTERHEARRIDNQLRGRSGRQGDPGETQFYVSLEDDLLRIFGSDRVKKMMGRFGIPEDMPIENRFITRSIESAQKKIEGFHFDARKSTLEYDDVMNHQRKIVYGRRQKMLRSDRESIEALLEDILRESSEGQEVREIVTEKRRQLGDEAFLETVRRIALHTNDALWMEHLEAMDYLRSSVNLRAYGQREPIVEYKKEGLAMFRAMETAFREQVLSLVKNINVEAGARAEVPAPRQTLVPNPNSQGLPSRHSQNEKKLGRNDPCFCGSGKKYKKCHGA